MSLEDIFRLFQEKPILDDSPGDLALKLKMARNIRQFKPHLPGDLGLKMSQSFDPYKDTLNLPTMPDSWPRRPDNTP